jgi:hypothetical protein
MWPRPKRSPDCPHLWNGTNWTAAVGDHHDGRPGKASA